VKLRKFDAINVVPFIDIMLVLLTIVLTTATFIAQGKIKVSLPEAKSTQSQSEKKELIITIKADGTIHADDKATDLDGLGATLDSLKKEDLVIIKSDKKASFEHFVAVIDLLKSKKHDNLAIATTKKAE
jgi:biopolymer transport protein ExbD